MTTSKQPTTHISSWLSRVQGDNALSGGALLFISMTFVNAGNYLFNLVLGRWLGPAAFSDLSLIVTLMLMITFVTVTFQLTAARFSAIHAADNDAQQMASVRQWQLRIAWGIGLFLMVILGGGALFWKTFFNTESALPFVILAIGLPVYFAQGVDRGVLQGQTRFGRLSVSYQAEMWARLAVAMFLVAIGWSVNGAVTGITLSFVATWFITLSAKDKLPKARPLSSETQKAILLFAWPVIIANVSQILINNSDILIVKRFFEAEEAGLYAALALIGRVIFFATWSVVTVLFPIVAQRHKKGEPHRHLLYVSLLLVLTVSGTIFAATAIFPQLIVTLLFGEAYLSIAPLIWLYALATAIYALSNVIVTYRLSIGDGFGSTIAILSGVAQVVFLWLFHNSLQQIVFMQIGLMGGMFLILLVWDGWLAWHEYGSPIYGWKLIKDWRSMLAQVKA
ncbi:MAG: O-antigen/teichoic acid export membrane protein [Cellvibrionaceae bacterium]|jgi:O-antigen/teichoic acid export membrane protein